MHTEGGESGGQRGASGSGIGGAVHSPDNIVHRAVGSERDGHIHAGRSRTDKGQLGSLAAADTDIVDVQEEHIGAVVVAESDMDRLAGIAAQVDAALHPSTSCSGAEDSGGGGEVADSVATGGDVHAIVFVGIVGILSNLIPRKGGVGQRGRDLHHRQNHPVVRRKGNLVVIVIRSRHDAGISAVYAEIVDTAGHNHPVETVVVAVDESESRRAVLEALSPRENADSVTGGLGRSLGSLLFVDLGFERSSCIHARLSATRTALSKTYRGKQHHGCKKCK